MEMKQKNLRPLGVPRTIRPDNRRILTSGNAGLSLPISYIPLLPEDGIRQGRIAGTVMMQETPELIINSVDVKVEAWYVPPLAFERFTSMDNVQRSLRKEKERDADGAAVPYFATATAGAHGANPIWVSMGLHAREGDTINDTAVAAYNVIQNHQRQMVSESLPLRTEQDTSLAPCFWNHETLRHIVPNFDQAKIDGEVPLNVVEASIPVTGFAYKSNLTGNMTGSGYVDENGNAVTTGTNKYKNLDSNQAMIAVDVEGGIANVFAELAADGITVSLANIEMAKKTAAFARLRETYQGHSDEYIIDLLMNGITVPEQFLSVPSVIGRDRFSLRPNQRFAMDGANLDKSVNNGIGAFDMRLRLPRNVQGGTVMVLVSITPEQLWERKQDNYLYLTDPDNMPQYLRDELDPEKVSVVLNEFVDTDHGTPLGTFGYAPLNHEWARDYAAIGGKYYRPAVDAATDEDRQKIWAVETVDPTLAEDFYLCTGMHQKVFADTEADGFEIAGRQIAVIEGNTVFGARITEGVDDYNTILAKVDQTRIEQE